MYLSFHMRTLATSEVRNVYTCVWNITIYTLFKDFKSRLNLYLSISIEAWSSVLVLLSLRFLISDACISNLSTVQCKWIKEIARYLLKSYKNLYNFICTEVVVQRCSFTTKISCVMGLISDHLQGHQFLKFLHKKYRENECEKF